MKRTIALVLLMTMVTAIPAMASSSQVEKVISVALKQVGKPYELLSNAPNSFNCFSFVAYCVNRVVPGKISAKRINGKYMKVKSLHALKAGDIVCFRKSSRLNGILAHHYGIYMGKGYFIHAVNRKDGVTVSKIGHYKKRFVGAVRIF